MISPTPTSERYSPEGEGRFYTTHDAPQEMPELLGSDPLDRLALNDSRLKDAVIVTSNVSVEENLDGTLFLGYDDDSLCDTTPSETHSLWKLEAEPA